MTGPRGSSLPRGRARGHRGPLAPSRGAEVREPLVLRTPVLRILELQRCTYSMQPLTSYGAAVGTRMEVSCAV